MKTRTCFTALFLSAVALPAFSQSPPGSIPVGPLFAYPELELSLQRNDNIALQPDNARVGDTIWVMRPSVRFEIKKGPDFYNFGYRGEYGRFDKQSTDNYENHELFADAAWFFDVRNKLNARAQFQDRVDPRGTLNLAATPTPNEYHQSEVQGLYTFGAEDAAGRIEAQGSYLDKRYTNNRFATFALDKNQLTYGGTFLWRVMPKTHATFTVRQTDHDYRDDTAALDSKDTFVLVGARWEATALTSGRFSIGHQSKRFDTGGRGRFSGVAWEGGINWKPLTYSTFDLTTKRSTTDSTGLGDFTINQSNQLTWTHAWSSRVSSVAFGSYATDKFEAAPIAGIGGANRDDKTSSAGLKLTYQFQRWLKFGAEYTWTERNSNDPTADYKRNLWMLTVSGTL